MKFEKNKIQLKISIAIVAHFGWIVVIVVGMVCLCHFFFFLSFFVRID